MDATQHRKRPFVLGFFSLILSLQAVVLPILLVALLLTPSSSPITYNGELVPIGSVRLEMLAIMMIWFAFAAFVGPGLWKGKLIARHVAFGTYAGFGLILAIVQWTWSELFWVVFCCLIVGGYLYAKPNVRAFFESYEPSKKP
jgi:hypothetical protein